jgi:hypothetical protein
MKRSGMFRERNERPSTAGEAEERSGYMELCEVRPVPYFGCNNALESSVAFSILMPFV